MTLMFTFNDDDVNQEISKAILYSAHNGDFSGSHRLFLVHQSDSSREENDFGSLLNI